MVPISQKAIARIILYIPKGMKVWFLINRRRNFTPISAEIKERTNPTDKQLIWSTENPLAFFSKSNPVLLSTGMPSDS